MVQFVTDFVGNPAILIGIVALVGLIAQGKRLSDILVGTVKTVVGVLVMFAGAGAVIHTLDQLGPMIQRGFGVEGLLPSNEVFVAVAMEQVGNLVAWVMLGGFLINVLLARVTRWRYIFLSGHHVLYESVLLVLLLQAARLSPLATILIGSIVSGVLYSALSALTRGYTREITGGQRMTIGHFGATGYFLAGLAGRLFGDKRTSIEETKLPESLQFLKETVAITSLVVAIFFLIVGAMAGPDYIATELKISQHWIVFAIMQGLGFGAGLLIIMTGVRMLLAEIVPAFDGIAERLVPGAIPALDCPAVYPFAPNAVIIGFLCSTLAGLVTTVAMRAAGGVLVVPPMHQHFFMGATAAVFGNATGGRRGAIIGACLNGVLFTILPVLAWPFTHVALAKAITFGDPDFCWTAILTGGALRILGLTP